MSEGELRVERTRVEAREVDGELVIYDLGTQRFLGGNATAAVLWPLLLEGTSLGAMAAALEARWDVEPDRALADAEAFAESLRAQGLLVGPRE